MTPTPRRSAVPGSPEATPSGIDGSTAPNREPPGQLVDQAQQTAGQVADQAKQQVTSQLESQKERAVDGLMTLAQALRQTSQHLQEQEQGAIGEYVGRAAERVEDVCDHLRSRDVAQLVAETQAFARRRPGMFVGAALAVGFAGARFLMSSGQRASARREAKAAVDPMRPAVA
jgi:hypothetical protein